MFMFLKSVPGILRFTNKEYLSGGFVTEAYF